ncbi:MAG: hypothetical protein D6702_02680 [Planctomycetota bacterium]|nr:MAG: hypothetical protein D6702_02680 [Planctomycetota bacterium]
MTPPAEVRRILRRLEARTLALLLAWGVGRLALAAALLLAGLYLADRAFEPPAPVRLVLAAGALLLFVARLRRLLLLPLRRRPSRRDLAAMWERSHPELRGLLATAVELPEAPPGTSAALLARVHEQVRDRLGALDERRAAPSGRARRSALRGLGAVLLLAGLAWRFPAEAEVFLARLAGGERAWPGDTELVLLPPFLAGGEAPPLEDLGGGRFRLAVANGSLLTLRVRAEGKVPERVLARDAGGERPMRPIGGGEFVLRLPPLAGRQEITFRGGDDTDGRPSLLLAGGDAPALRDWTVRVEPPAYTDRPAEDSPLAEFRVPAGTVLTARFRTDPVAERVLVRSLTGDHGEADRQADGWWSFRVEATGSGEAILETVGGDGFRNPRAGVLRWQADPDRPPRASFLWPDEAWATVAGGTVPLVVEAEDDYGLAEAELLVGEDGESEPLALGGGGRLFLARPAPAPPDGAAESGATTRLRFLLRALDAAPPAGQETVARSPWVEVLGAEAFEARHAQRMVRAREKVERLLDRTEALLAPEPSAPRPQARRIEREIGDLERDLERVLLERIYAGLDPEAEVLRPALDRLLASAPPAPGEVATAVTAGGVRPLDRAGLLLDLARAAEAARTGPAAALLAAVEEGNDPIPPATELRGQLQEMLDILLAWEDLQSAVDLLRSLLDRQRALYLRTKEASAR